MIWDAEDALRALYGDGLRDLTRDGYQEELRRLRKQNPNLSRQVERILRPYLEKRVFPRRQIEWPATSIGTRARLALLPENPHVHEDALVVRAVLGIPDDQVQADEGSIAWKHLQDFLTPQAARRVAEGSLALSWLHVHIQTAIGQTVLSEDVETLPPAMQESAVRSAKVKLASADIPNWLQLPPSGPAPYNQDASPIEWATGRLVECHRLPWSIALALTFYVLTLDNHRLSGLEPLQVSINYGDEATRDPDAFTVAVHGIGEIAYVVASQLALSGVLCLGGIIPPPR